MLTQVYVEERNAMMTQLIINVIFACVVCCSSEGKLQGKGYTAYLYSTRSRKLYACIAGAHNGGVGSVACRACYLLVQNQQSEGTYRLWKPSTYVGIPDVVQVTL